MLGFIIQRISPSATCGPGSRDRRRECAPKDGLCPGPARDQEDCKVIIICYLFIFGCREKVETAVAGVVGGSGASAAGPAGTVATPGGGAATRRVSASVCSTQHVRGLGRRRSSAGWRTVPPQDVRISRLPKNSLVSEGRNLRVTWRTVAGTTLAAPITTASGRTTSSAVT